MTAANAGEEELSLFQTLSGMRSSSQPGGITLLDTANGNRHMPLMVSDQSCHCTEFEETDVPPGGEQPFWIAFPAPPDGVEAMTVTTTISPAILDVPVVGAAGEDAELAEADTLDPDIRPYTAFQDGDQIREEGATESTVMLSADVLFDVDESELTGEADAELEKVAKEIDAAQPEEVAVDGYTDSTGDDSINEPLSRDRAEAVQRRLEELTTVDTSFTAEGHGSSDPIASNESDEGREKNRRVAVGFAR